MMCVKIKYSVCVCVCGFNNVQPLKSNIKPTGYLLRIFQLRKRTSQDISTYKTVRCTDHFHGKKSPVFWWFYQTVNVLKMPRSRPVFSFRNSQGKLGVHNPLTPGKFAVYVTFSSTRKTWLNSALSLVNRTFYQTVNVRKISRSWLVFQLRKRQGQLGIHHHLTEGKYAVHVTLSSTWKTGLNSSFSLVKRKFYQTVNVVKIKRS